MKHYVGLDVSMKKTSVCIVNEQGKIVYEFDVKTDPHALADAIEKTALKIEIARCMYGCTKNECHSFSSCK